MECFELTAASGRYQIWTVQLPARGLFSHFLVLGFCHWDKQNSVKKNLPISSDIYTFNNLKASFIIFHLDWYPAAVALDWDLLNITFSKEPYDHLNFAKDSSMDKQHAVNVLCRSTSRRLDYHVLCGKCVRALLDFPWKGQEKQRRTIWTVMSFDGASTKQAFFYTCRERGRNRTYTAWFSSQFDTSHLMTENSTSTETEI